MEFRGPDIYSAPLGAETKHSVWYNEIVHAHDFMPKERIGGTKMDHCRSSIIKKTHVIFVRSVWTLIVHCNNQQGHFDHLDRGGRAREWNSKNWWTWKVGQDDGVKMRILLLIQGRAGNVVRGRWLKLKHLWYFLLDYRREYDHTIIALDCEFGSSFKAQAL